MFVLLIGSDGKLANDFKKLFIKYKIIHDAIDKEDLDITDTELLNLYFINNNKYDVIINCAAYNDVDKAELEKNECRKLNTEIPLKLAMISKKIEAIFVTFSTDFVFDGKKKDEYIETDTANPLSVYGISKLEGEKHTLLTYEKTFVIRTSWLFGIKNNDFVKQIINWSKKKNTLNIVDDQISAPTYSKDLAEIAWKLIKTKKFGLYHITNNGVCSKYEQAKYILNKISWNGKLKKAKTIDFNLLAKRAKYSKLSSKKLEYVIDEKIPDWKNAIDRFIEELSVKGELQ